MVLSYIRIGLVPVALATAAAILATKAAATQATPTAAAQATVSAYVSTSGQDRNPCTSSSPCATFARAYQVAEPGTTVEVAGGSYVAQTLPRDPRKDPAKPVVFQPASGTSVALAGFDTGNSKTAGYGARGFELREMKVSGSVYLRWGVEDAVLRNIDASRFVLTSVRRVQVLGGDLGPMLDEVSHIHSCGVSGCFPSEDVVIDGAFFHDYTISNPAKHAECLMIWPGKRITIRNSTFRNCTDYDVFVKEKYNSDLTYENNFFDEPMPGDTATVNCSPGCPRGGPSITFSGGGGGWSGLAIRYNSLLGTMRIDPAITDVVVKGNVGRKDKNFDCQGQVSFSYNVWSNAKCSASDRTAVLADVFVGAGSSAFDPRLKSGSRAIGAGDPNDRPARDIKGRMRPIGFAPDAGAWQREPALVVTGRAIGTAKIGDRRAELIEFYGRPRTKTTAKFPDGTRLPVDSYRVRGGSLRVTFRNEKAVAIATTSSYYRTGRGLGPGAPLRARANEDGTCRPVGGQVGKARLYVRSTRAKKPVVAELVVVAARYKPPCAEPRSDD